MPLCPWKALQTLRNFQPSPKIDNSQKKNPKLQKSPKTLQKKRQIKLQKLCKKSLRKKQNFFKEAGLSFCNAAVRSYEELVNDCFGPGSKAAVAQRLEPATVNKFAADAMMALNAAVQSYNADIGFADLPNALAPFASEYYFTEASPVLVRKALMEGLMNMMTYAVGEVAMTESVQHTWMKLYRIVEQSIIANIISR